MQHLRSVRIERVRDSHPHILLSRRLPPQVVKLDNVLNQVVGCAALSDLLTLPFLAAPLHGESDLVLPPDLRMWCILIDSFLRHRGEIVIEESVILGGRLQIGGCRFLILDHGGDPILELQMLLEA